MQRYGLADDQDSMTFFRAWSKKGSDTKCGSIFWVRESAGAVAESMVENKKICSAAQEFS